MTRNDAQHLGIDMVALRAEHFSHLHNLEAHREMTERGEKFWAERAPAPEVDSTESRHKVIPMITVRQIELAMGAKPQLRKLK